MKLRTLFGDLLTNLFHRPATERYPAVKPALAPGYRGVLQYTPTNCTGCCLCVKDCPADAIELITVDKVNKRFVLRYHADRCAFCAQCVQNCRFGCLQMSDEQWASATLDKQPFTVLYGDPADVETVLGKTDHTKDSSSGQAACTP